VHAVMTNADFAPEELPEPGRLYQHYKGDFYRIVCTGNLSEDRDVVMIGYRSMKYGRVWFRPWKDRPNTKPCAFSGIVKWPDGVERPRYVAVAALPSGAIANDN
jgi:hypothetical protein